MIKVTVTSHTEQQKQVSLRAQVNLFLFRYFFQDFFVMHRCSSFQTK